MESQVFLEERSKGDGCDMIKGTITRIDGTITRIDDRWPGTEVIIIINDTEMAKQLHLGEIELKQ
jgi:hypothetical protein